MPTMTPAEEEKILKRILKDELEQKGFFVKIGQTGGVTILRGEPGGEQEIVDSGLTVRDAGKKYRLWGDPNRRPQSADKAPSFSSFSNNKDRFKGGSQRHEQQTQQSAAKSRRDYFRF